MAGKIAMVVWTLFWILLGGSTVWAIMTEPSNGQSDASFAGRLTGAVLFSFGVWWFVPAAIRYFRGYWYRPPKE